MFFKFYGVGWVLFFLLCNEFIQLAVLYVKALMLFFLVISENKMTSENVSVICLEIAWNLSTIIVVSNKHTVFLFICVFFSECGGKMHLREGEFEKAHTDFFEAFKNYDESGSPRRTTCLKYLVLANMLMKSGINPFDSQEVFFFFFFCTPPHIPSPFSEYTEKLPKGWKWEKKI